MTLRVASAKVEELEVGNEGSAVKQNPWASDFVWVGCGVPPSHVFFFLMVRSKQILVLSILDEQMNSLDGHFHEQMRYWLGGWFAPARHGHPTCLFVFKGNFQRYIHTPSIFAKQHVPLCLVGKHKISMGFPMVVGRV